MAKGHCLPVVAEGLIPLIYRRAFFKHRATPVVIAPEEESAWYIYHARDEDRGHKKSPITRQPKAPLARC